MADQEVIDRVMRIRGQVVQVSIRARSRRMAPLFLRVSAPLRRPRLFSDFGPDGFQNAHLDDLTLTPNS